MIHRHAHHIDQGSVYLEIPRASTDHEKGSVTPDAWKRRFGYNMESSPGQRAGPMRGRYIEMLAEHQLNIAFVALERIAHVPC